MSTTFKSITNSQRFLEVMERSDCINFWIYGDQQLGIAISPSDAPALALAILEAAGVEPLDPASKLVLPGTPEYLGQLAFAFARHNEWKAKNESATREQAELEDEALEYYEASYDARGLARVTAFHMLSERQKTEWLAVARRAREMRAEK